jgi:hypothetical protein
MEYKFCPKCKNTRSTINFSKDKYHKDGLQSYCKLCKSIEAKKYKSTPEFKKHVKDYQQTEKYRKTHIISSRNYIKNNPEKQRAREVARRHIKKFDHCELCNSKINLEKHHPNYNFPLKIVTLCKLCHEEIHHAKRI